MRLGLLVILSCSFAAPLLTRAQTSHALPAGAPTSRVQTTDSAYIRQAESDWAESMASYDASVLERVLADDFVETAVDGTRLFKPDVITWYRTHHSEYAFNRLGQIWIRVSGDAAITQGTEIWRKTDGTSGSYVWTDTWVKRGGKWQAIASASQATTGNNATVETAMTTTKDNGIVTIASKRSVDQTVENIQATLKTKGVKLFALIDHSGEAKVAGLEMRPTKLLIFGSPKGGTPLMVASPSIAIDLPLKLLVWEDSAGKAWISYNAPAYLQARHNLPQALVPVLAVVEGLAAKAAE